MLAVGINLFLVEEQPFKIITKANRIKLSGSKKESLPFSAKMNIDYTEEANQIFEEAWNTIQDRFYDPNHHGQNWTALKNTYKPSLV